MKLTRILSAAATGVALAVAPVAMTSAAAQEATQSEAIPGEMIDAFVLAAIDVAEVQQSYAASFETAEDDAERQAIIEEAQTAMIAAVEEADGITVDEYMQISDAAQTDEELNQRISATLEERTQAEED